MVRQRVLITKDVEHVSSVLVEPDAVGKGIDLVAKPERQGQDYVLVDRSRQSAGQGTQ